MSVLLSVQVHRSRLIREVAFGNKVAVKLLRHGGQDLAKRAESFQVVGIGGSGNVQKQHFNPETGN